jgi:hypothetical protein
MPTSQRHLPRLQHSSSEPKGNAPATLDYVVRKRSGATRLPEPETSAEILSFPRVPGSAVASALLGTCWPDHPHDLPPAA